MARHSGIPAERQVLFLMVLKSSQSKKGQPVLDPYGAAPEETRQQCPAWEFQAGARVLVHQRDHLWGRGAKELGREDGDMPAMHGIRALVFAVRNG